MSNIESGCVKLCPYNLLAKSLIPRKVPLTCGILCAEEKKSMNMHKTKVCDYGFVTELQYL